MSDEEFIIQVFKIFLGAAVGIVVIYILWHINYNLATLITKNQEIINKLR